MTKSTDMTYDVDSILSSNFPSRRQFLIGLFKVLAGVVSLLLVWTQTPIGDAVVGCFKSTSRATTRLLEEEKSTVKASNVRNEFGVLVERREVHVVRDNIEAELNPCYYLTVFIPAVIALLFPTISLTITAIRVGLGTVFMALYLYGATVIFSYLQFHRLLPESFMAGVLLSLSFIVMPIASLGGAVMSYGYWCRRRDRISEPFSSKKKSARTKR